MAAALSRKRRWLRRLILKSEGGNAFLRTVTRKGVRSAISENLWQKIDNPIVFKYLGGDSADSQLPTADGYEATTLIEVCDALIQARNDDLLEKSQYFLAVQAEIIIRSAAKLGIIALVDAATGYIEDIKKEEYLKLWQEFVQQEFRQCDQEFPNQYADMIYKIYGLKRKNPKSFKHPQFFGWFTRKYIYHPLANSRGAILDLLDEANPIVYAGGTRKFKLHQFLTEQVGLPALRQHLWQTIGIGNSSRDKQEVREGLLSRLSRGDPPKANRAVRFL